MSEENKKQPTIEEIRAARKADQAKAEEAQYQQDLRVINDLEIEHGDNNIATRRVPFTPGLPVMIAVRTPKVAEIKRYRSRIKPQDMASATSASIELGKSCLVYPSDDVFDRMIEARPGIDAQAGLAASELATARSADEGKG